MLKKFSFLLVFLTATHLHASLQFEIEKGGFDPEDEKITLKQDDAALGFLLYRRELPKVAYIHSFYIKPEWRNNGHGHHLLTYALAHLQGKGYKTIALIPGPFELNDGFLTPTNDEARKEWLVRFYQKNGFKKTLLLKPGSLYYGSLAPIILHFLRGSAVGAINGLCYVAAATILWEKILHRKQGSLEKS